MRLVLFAGRRARKQCKHLPRNIGDRLGEALARDDATALALRDWPLAIGDTEAALAAASPRLAGLLRRRFAVHESGHAIAAIAFKLGTVTSVRIDASGGTTQIRRDLMRDQDEIYVHDELTMTMACRAADAEILGSVGAGSGGLRDSDLDHATRLAAAMEGAQGCDLRDDPRAVFLIFS